MTGVQTCALPISTLLSANPAKIARLWPQKGAIQIGADADLLIVDTEREWTVEPSCLKSRHPHSPFLGWRMKGWLNRVLSRGRTVVADGDVTVDRGGQWLQQSINSSQ